MRHLEVEKIILFGSYATGKWVEDTYVKDGTTYEYKSDYDILIVTDQRIYEVSRRWEEVKEAIRSNPFLTRTVMISHIIKFLNEKIRDNYYFYVDIAREGILLYDRGNYELDSPQPLSPKKRLGKAEEDFEYWFRKGEEFFMHYRYAIKDKGYSMAAFLLHQSTESYYAALLLVFTDYRPKTHDLEELCHQATKVSEVLKAVFPRQAAAEKRAFDLLRRAYVDARYDKTYTITLQELQYLSERVLLLRALTEQLCKEEMQRLKEAIGGQ
ncbi:MAG: HEPN domain-containing protein [Roseivirga sp.]